MTTKKYKILIVDDEALVADTTARVLASELPAHEVLVSTSPGKAIQILQEQEIAVLLCDLQMPAFDGTAVLKAAHEVNPATVAILLTGHATKDSLIRALNEGHLWRCIEKPWTINQLCSTVEDAITAYDEAIASARPVAIEAEAAPDVQQTPALKWKRMSVRASDLHAKPMRLIPKVARLRLKLVDKRYQNLTLISEGGSANVYKAEDTLLGMPVAIKVVSDNFAKNEDTMKVLLREARIAMRLSNSHIVRLHNVEGSAGFYYLVMEYIDGCTFRSLLAQYGALPDKMVLQILDICEDTLGYAHRHHVYHRDLKPENLMLTGDGILKIIDFGLADLALESVRKRDVIAGTPFYISPEEIAGESSDQRADIYSLAIIIHELLTGIRPPHCDGTTPADPFQYVPVPASELPEAVQNVMRRAFVRNPAHRWPDVQEFAKNLRHAIQRSHEPENS